VFFALLVAYIFSKIDETFWVFLFFDAESKSTSPFPRGYTNPMHNAGGVAHQSKFLVFLFLKFGK